MSSRVFVTLEIAAFAAFSAQSFGRRRSLWRVRNFHHWRILCVTLFFRRRRTKAGFG
jgi:hypothetical protein